MTTGAHTTDEPHLLAVYKGRRYLFLLVDNVHMSVDHDIWYILVSIMKFAADVASKVRDKCHWPAGWRLAATSPHRDLAANSSNS